jgi:hypothetical protein
MTRESWRRSHHDKVSQPKDQKLARRVRRMNAAVRRLELEAART